MSSVHDKCGRFHQSLEFRGSVGYVVSPMAKIVSPTSSTTLLAVPALSATYIAPKSAGCEMMARILL